MSFRVNGAALPVFKNTLKTVKAVAWNNRSWKGKALVIGAGLSSIGVVGCTVSALYRIHGPRDLSIPIVYKASASCIQESEQQEAATLRIKFTPTQDRKIVGFSTYRQFSLDNSFSNGQKAIGCKTLVEAIHESEDRRTLLVEAPTHVTQLTSSDDLALSLPLTPSWLYVNYIPRGLTTNNDLARAVIGKTGKLTAAQMKTFNDDQLLGKINPTLIYLPQGTSTMRDISSALYSGTQGDFHPDCLFPFPRKK